MINDFVKGQIPWNDKQLFVDKRTQEVSIRSVSKKNTPLNKMATKEAVYKINDIFKDALFAEKTITAQHLGQKKIEKLLNNLTELQNFVDNPEKKLLENCIKNIQSASKFKINKAPELTEDQRQALSDDLLRAINGKNVNQAKLLLSQGADPNVKDWNKKSALHNAIKNQSEDMVLLLLDYDADINAQDRYENTALHLAIEIQSKEMVELLLSHGADMNARNNMDFIPLQMAVNNKSVEMVTLLLDHGADINVQSFAMGSLLHIAASARSEEMVLLLLSKGADINSKDKDGKTALHNAVLQKSEDMALFLLDQGADAKTIMKESRRTPTFDAIVGGCSEDLIKRLKKQDQGLSDWWLQQSLIAHRFGFNISVDFLDQNDLVLEGNRPELTYRALIQSLKDFVQNNEKSKEVQAEVPGWSQKDWEAVISVLQKAVENFRSFVGYNKDPTVIQAFPCGWYGHATGVAVSGNLLIKANRGLGSGDHPGLTIYEIQNSNLIKREINLRYLINKKELEEGEDFFKSTIDYNLDLEDIAYIRHKEQHAGNCPWAAVKLLLKGICYLQLRNKDKEMSHEEAAKNSEILYRAWFNDDRERAVQELLISFESTQSTPHSKEIKEQMTQISEAVLTEVLYKCLTGKESESRENIFTSILEKQSSLAMHQPQFKNPSKESLLDASIRRNLPNYTAALNAAIATSSIT